MGKAAAEVTAPADELEDEPAALDDPPSDETDDESGAAADSESGESEASTDTDEVLVTIGDPPETSDDDPASAPAWVGELRKSNDQKVKRIRELERENAALKGTKQADQPASPGPKPKLEDFAHDEEEFSTALLAWNKRQIDVETAQRQKNEAEANAKAAWEKHLSTVNTAAEALKVSGRQEAQEAFEDQLSTVQQAIVMHGPNDPKTAAMLRHALGTNPNKLRELAGITDPVKFAFAVADLVPKLKTTPKRVAPPPERVVNGSASIVAGNVEKRRASLIEEAARTGSINKLMAFEKKLEETKKRS